MCILNIKGLRFYGRLNDEHFKALFKLADVLKSSYVKDIKGVYCTDGKKEIKKDEIYNSAYYIKFTRVSPKSCIRLELKYSNNEQETIRVYKSPIIVINGDLCHTEYDFIFTLLHEIGHHLYNDFCDTQKQREIAAHMFAIKMIRQLYPLQDLPVKRYLYLEEALDKCI